MDLVGPLIQLVLMLCLQFLPDYQIICLTFWKPVFMDVAGPKLGPEFQSVSK